VRGDQRLINAVHGQPRQRLQLGFDDVVISFSLWLTGRDVDELGASAEASRSESPDRLPASPPAHSRSDVLLAEDVVEVLNARRLQRLANEDARGPELAAV